MWLNSLPNTQSVTIGPHDKALWQTRGLQRREIPARSHRLRTRSYGFRLKCERSAAFYRRSCFWVDTPRCEVTQVALRSQSPSDPKAEQVGRPPAANSAANIADGYDASTAELTPAGSGSRQAARAFPQRRDSCRKKDGWPDRSRPAQSCAGHHRHSIRMSCRPGRPRSHKIHFGSSDPATQR